MKRLIALISILLVVWVSIGIILYRPDLFPFQPTVGTNIAILAVLLSAFVTVVLAFSNYLTITNNEQQNERNRRESLLNEIIEWAQWAYTLVLGYPAGTVDHIYRTFGSLQTIRAKQVSLATLAQKRLSDELATQINNTRPLLDGFIECVEKTTGNEPGGKPPLPAGIDEAFIKLIEDASALRAGL